MPDERNEQNSINCAKPGDAEPRMPDGKEDAAGTGSPCPDCKGVGSVLLLTSQRSCEKCYGTGKLPCLKRVEESIQAADSKSAGESPRQMSILITRIEFTEDEDGKIVDVKEISREEKLVPVSAADERVEWPADSILHESWPCGEIAYYEYDSEATGAES